MDYNIISFMFGVSMDKETEKLIIGIVMGIGIGVVLYQSFW